jgi:hypothetical protein
MRHILAASILLLGSSIAFAAEPTGSYKIVGQLDGVEYSGTVSVKKTGETYNVVWVVAGQKYVGTGIGNKESLAVSYRSGNDTGLAIFEADGGNWDGQWAYTGGQKVGTEVWKRQ